MDYDWGQAGSADGSQAAWADSPYSFSGQDAHGFQQAIADTEHPQPGAMQVPGPGALWGGLGSPPSQVQGQLPRPSGLNYQLDRINGTLNFSGADRQVAASLAVHGNTITTPDGHQAGTLRHDGGFNLDPDYAADLARCHAAASHADGPQMTPIPPLAAPMA